jgi:hypothetical protein
MAKTHKILKNEVTEKNIRYGLTFKPTSNVVDDSYLSDNLCLFCNGTEKNYKPGPDIQFICATCLQLFLHADAEDLKRAYKKALDMGYLRKIMAIETFLPREEKHGKRPSKSVKRNFNRERATRSFRDKKRFPQPVEA